VRARGGGGDSPRDRDRGGGDRGSEDETRALRQRLRDLEDRLTGDRARGLDRRDDRDRDGGGGGDDVESLRRENRDLKRELGRSSRDVSKSGGFGYDGGRTGGKAPPWHAMVSQDDDVIDELVGAIGTAHGSVGQWLNTAATPLEKRNFIEFVQTLEEFEARRGLTPQSRSADDVSGTIHLALGPTIRCQLKFLV